MLHELDAHRRSILAALRVARRRRATRPPTPKPERLRSLVPRTYHRLPPRAFSCEEVGGVRRALRVSEQLSLPVFALVVFQIVLSPAAMPSRPTPRPSRPRHRPGRCRFLPELVTRTRVRDVLHRADRRVGLELWKTDGTSAGTSPVEDIREGSRGSKPQQLTDLNGTVFFVANNGNSRSGALEEPGVPRGHRPRQGHLPRSARLLRGLAHRRGGHAVLHRRRRGARGPALEERRNRGGNRHGGGHQPRGRRGAPEWLDAMSMDTLFFAADRRRGRDRELWRSDGTHGGNGPRQGHRSGAARAPSRRPS